jgi:hypothetical protein
LTLFCHFSFSLGVSSIISSTFAIVGIILAALTPAKVSEVTSNTSAMPAAKAPRMIYVNSFSISQATTSDETQSSGEVSALASSELFAKENRKASSASAVKSKKNKPW